MDVLSVMRVNERRSVRQPRESESLVRGLYGHSVYENTGAANHVDVTQTVRLCGLEDLLARYATTVASVAVVRHRRHQPG
ncbi:MAG: hypothetical protein H0V18_13255 [Pyrinomonadaceae bacterium]|nr:hypothetical protein [Pyrinomonadaceae bacterium]